MNCSICIFQGNFLLINKHLLRKKLGWGVVSFRGWSLGESRKASTSQVSFSVPAQKRWHFLVLMHRCAAVSELWPENREQMDEPGLEWGVYSYPHDSEYSSLLFDGGTQSKLGRCLLSMGEAPFAWVSRCQRTKANCRVTYQPSSLCMENTLSFTIDLGFFPS